jgi:hypothetical protein
MRNAPAAESPHPHTAFPQESSPDGAARLQETSLSWVAAELQTFGSVLRQFLEIASIFWRKTSKTP